MLHALINFLLNRKGHPVQKDTTLDAVAPYKVEPPAPVVEVKSDAGTWPFPKPASAEEKPAEKPKKPRARKAPVAAITAAPKKPRAKKAPKAE